MIIGYGRVGSFFFAAESCSLIRHRLRCSSRAYFCSSEDCYFASWFERVLTWTRSERVLNSFGTKKAEADKTNVFSGFFRDFEKVSGTLTLVGKATNYLSRYLRFNG